VSYCSLHMAKDHPTAQPPAPVTMPLLKKGG
jgi:hypothetical protein